MLEVLQAVTAQSDSDQTRVLDDVAEVPTDASGATAIDAHVEGGLIEVPTDPAAPLAVSVPNSDVGMAITLPFASAASDAYPLDAGVVAFDNRNESHTAAVVKEDSSVLIASVLSGPEAPNRYEYQVEGKVDSHLELQADGSVYLLGDAQSDILGGFFPAWARDASGQPVPTQYEVDDNLLTQVLDLSSPNIVYPVVADPQAGYTILEGVWKDRAGGYKYKSGDQWSTKLSSWGFGIWILNPAGHQYVKTQGWVEWKNGIAPTTTTIHQQFDCHAVYGYNVKAAGLWWDFETARKSNPDWLVDPQLCNWP